MEFWQIIVIPIITVVLNFLTRPLEILLVRKRTGSINSIRIISEFFTKYGSQLVSEPNLLKEINDWIAYPNALGSESQVAVLVGKLCAITNIPDIEKQIIDKALNALDQRATERERTKLDE